MGITRRRVWWRWFSFRPGTPDLHEQPTLYTLGQINAGDRSRILMNFPAVAKEKGPAQRWLCKKSLSSHPRRRSQAGGWGTSIST